MTKPFPPEIERWLEELVARMQTPESARAWDALFKATPKQLGEAYLMNKKTEKFLQSWRQRRDRAWEAAEAYDGILRSDDPRFDGVVHLAHKDGTCLFFREAFLVRYLGFLIVFSEHHRYHVYDPEDLASYGYFRQARIFKLRPGDIPDA